MSKLLVPIAIGAVLIGAAFLTGGLSLAPTLAASAAAGSTVAVAGGVAITTVGLTVGTSIVAAAGILGTIGTSLLIAGATSILSGVAGAIQGAPKASAAQLSRLNPTFVPAAPRKSVVGGITAMAADVRYVEPSGTDQAYFDYIITVASHAATSIDEIWFEDRIAWTVGGGVDAFYAGSPAYLVVDVRLEGAAANAITINSGARWSASTCRLTGCAYIHLRIKRTGNSSKAASPLPQGLPGRVTIKGRGAPVYDPRRDSTNGGSGSHRPGTQSTWEFTNGSTVLGINPALQVLWYLLGWRINGKLAVGCGLPVSRIDLASFIAAANLCDEAVTLSAGGTQRRYEAHGVFSEDQTPLTILDTILTSCGGTLTDTNGRLGIEIAHNDLSGSIPAFTDGDVLGDFAYDPTPSLNETTNIIRGQYTDPSDASLFQLKDFPEVSLASPDGIERPANLQLAMVQDGNRAQRIAKQMLQRAQYQGVFTATYGPRALTVKRGSVITQTWGPLNFTAKLFRVMQQTITAGSGEVAMVLREENANTYAWDRDERAVVVAAGPIVFDARNNPLAITQGSDIGVENGATAADNMVQNAGLTTDATGWVISSGASRAFPATPTTEPIPAWIAFTGSGQQAYGNFGIARPLLGATRLYLSAYAIVTSGAGGTINRIYWAKADGSAATPAYSDLAINPSGPNIWTFAETVLTVPAGAVAFTPQIISSIAGTGAGGGLRLAKTQAGADVTATVLTAKGIQDGATRTAPAGAWTAPHDYLSGDIVTYSGTSWVATAPHTSVGGQPPGVSIYWQLLAAAGVDGTDGADGAPGPIGPAAPPFTTVGTGTSLGPTVFLEAGAAISFDITVSASAGGSGGGSCVTQAQASITGTGSWSVFASVSSSNVATEPIFNEINPATFPNTTGVARSFDFRVVSTGFAGRTVVPDQSYIRGV